ncbi:MAG: 6-phosphofructokinase [Fluviicola sp.]|nr:6-phosphofructokinase [Fluviicola sp.]
MESMKAIGVLTSGGDAPGMNACVRAVVKSGIAAGLKVFGIQDGYQGLIEGRMAELTYLDVNNIIQLGGTILGTARSKEFMTVEGRKKAIDSLNENHIEGLVLIGGDGTFAGGAALSKEMNIPVIGIPGTIDNDISGTEFTIGYDTCLNTVIDAVDKIRDTATSHHRVFFVEVMGRNSGYIALNAAIASGAESVLIPEQVTDIVALADSIKHQNKGVRSSIIIVAEGDDGGGALEIMQKISPLLPGYDLRHSVLGHIQRGGKPSATDRILATRMGAFAVDQLLKGRNNVVVGVVSDELITTPIGATSTSSADKSAEKLSLLGAMLTKG